MATASIFGIRRAHASIAALALALTSLACAVGVAGRRAYEPVARQEWQHARGPVVPHDTFPRDCSLCHAGSTWQKIRDDFNFDHARATGVTLKGAHDAAECLRCHNDRGHVAEFAARGCVGCHEDIHQGRLGSSCDVCHDESAPDWSPRGAIAEHAKTRFPLVGAHTTTACWACHPGAQVGNFVQTSTRCVDCHAKDLAVATEPDHQIQGWTDSCERCHLPTDWSRAGFAHGFFPLQGGHGGLECSACHAGNDFSGLDSSCFACHADDYAAARDHEAQNFGTDCQRCHTIQSWERANFDHAGIVSACIACHADDYDATTQPDHGANGIGTSCLDCHSTRSWGDGSFEHRQFPIQGGDHGDLDCLACHEAPGMFRQFTCVSCHTHSPREMNSKHDRVRGYTYQSSACLKCHPNGEKR